MHGVGHMFVAKSFEGFGFKPFIPVEEQQHPDPEFPTVKFPNPEEAGMAHISFVFRSQG
jgi:phosphoglucomutase